MVAFTCGIFFNIHCSGCFQFVVPRGSSLFLWVEMIGTMLCLWSCVLALQLCFVHVSCHDSAQVTLARVKHTKAEDALGVAAFEHHQQSSHTHYETVSLR